jgi:hypothetical protein
MEYMACCERCEMDRAYLRVRTGPKASGSEHVRLQVADLAQGDAYLPGCPHKGDDPDYDRWGELDAPGAGRAGNGEHVCYWRQTH